MSSASDEKVATSFYYERCLAQEEDVVHLCERLSRT